MEQAPQEIQFKALFEKNYAKLFYLAVSMVGDEDDARDIVGDFFASLWEQTTQDNTFNDSYLYRGIQLRCIDFVKHRSVRNRYHDYILSSQQPLFCEDNIEEERLAIIESVIRQMPERTRFVMDQCYMEGKKYVEVAELLNISRDGVRKHITKGLRMLRDAFSNKKPKS